MLRAEFGLPSITAEDVAPERKAPIRVKFEIPYFTVSGIQVHVSTFFVPWGCGVFLLFSPLVQALLLCGAFACESE